jgi:endoglucanase
VEPFLKQQWHDKTKISSVYALNGIPMTSYSDLSTSSGPLSLFSITDAQIAKEIFDSEYSNMVYAKDRGNILNYYNDNWAWFGTALYLNKLPNLYENTSPN